MTSKLTAVRLPESQKALLQALKKRLNCSESDVLRDALSIGLQQLLLQSMSVAEQEQYVNIQSELINQKAAELANLEARRLLVQSELDAAQLSIKYINI